jgi:hypothetical protein
MRLAALTGLLVGAMSTAGAQAQSPAPDTSLYQVVRRTTFSSLSASTNKTANKTGGGDL